MFNARQLIAVTVLRSWHKVGRSFLTFCGYCKKEIFIHPNTRYETELSFGVLGFSATCLTPECDKLRTKEDATDRFLFYNTRSDLTRIAKRFTYVLGERYL